jgi:hypothetical protein
VFHLKIYLGSNRKIMIGTVFLVLKKRSLRLSVKISREKGSISIIIFNYLLQNSKKFAEDLKIG